MWTASRGTRSCKEHVKNAYESRRGASTTSCSATAARRALATSSPSDKDMQSELRKAVDELRRAGERAAGQVLAHEAQLHPAPGRHRARRPLQPGHGPGDAQVAEGKGRSAPSSRSSTARTRTRASDRPRRARPGSDPGRVPVGRVRAASLWTGSRPCGDACAQALARHLSFRWGNLSLAAVAGVRPRTCQETLPAGRAEARLGVDDHRAGLASPNRSGRAGTTRASRLRGRRATRCRRPAGAPRRPSAPGRDRVPAAEGEIVEAEPGAQVRVRVDRPVVAHPEQLTRVDLEMEVRRRRRSASPVLPTKPITSPACTCAPSCASGEKAERWA